MQLQRLSRLSDLIFAGAMTVMVLTFEPLPLQEMTSQEVSVFLQAQLPSLGAYALTFVLIAYYWLAHLHQFQHYQKTDTVHLWLTLLSLMFIAVLPYANDLVTFYDRVFILQVFYSLSVAGVGIFSTAAWIYATQQRRLVDPDLPDCTIQQIRRESYAEPTVALLAIIGAWVHPLGWTLTFLVGLPLIFWIQTLLPSEKSESESG